MTYRLPAALRIAAMIVAVLLVFLAARQIQAGSPGNTYIVTTTADNLSHTTCTNQVSTSDCSLRSALTAAQAHLPTVDPDVIEFHILPGGTQTIHVDYATYGGLPAISDSLVIDGTSQPVDSVTNDCIGATGRPCIVIDGGGTTGLSYGFSIGAGTVTIQGLSLVNFGSGAAVWASGGSGHVFKRNFIGTVDGTTAAGNATGIILFSIATGPSDVTIGGTDATDRNVIVASLGDGMTIQQSSGTTIRGNYVGIGSDGLTALANNGVGITLGNSPNATIGGTTAGARNVIGSNNDGGVSVFASDLVTIQGNYIGTNATGTLARPNVGSGVYIVNASNTTVGGSTASARNVLSGNTAAGVFLSGSTQVGQAALVQNNYIGLNAAGTSAIPNDYGIRGSGDGRTADGNLIYDNVISGNTHDGIFLEATSTSTAAQNQIGGNIIGLNPAATSVIANGGSGVHLASDDTSSAANNTISTDPNGKGNVISGNAFNGIRLNGPNTQNTGIFHDLIGTNGAGNAPRGNTLDGIALRDGAHDTEIQYNTIAANANGVTISDGAKNASLLVNFIGTNSSLDAGLGNSADGVTVDTSDNFIGSAMEPLSRAGGGGNTIRNNGDDGIAVGFASRVAISANSIDDNGGLGIEEGAMSNNGQNQPALTAATSNGSQTEVSGTLTSLSNTSFQIEFFASPACDPSGAGEGRDYLGATSVNTDPSGDATIQAVLDSSVAGGQSLTATASDPLGNTSPFSQCQAVISTVTPTPSPSPTASPTATPTPTPSPSPTASVPAGLLGDANCDTHVTIDDVPSVLSGILGVPPGAPCPGNADTNCNKALDGDDALRILKFLAPVIIPPISGCRNLGQ